MSPAALLALAFGGWVICGTAIALVLGRRGHDGAGWFALGALLGPLALVFAVEAWSDEAPRRLSLRPAANADPAAVDLVVGYDGSAGSEAAGAAAISLLGERLGRVTLTMVIPFDDRLAAEREAKAKLLDVAERFAPLDPGLEIIRGHPASALASYAIDEGYDLLAIGTTGAGVHLFGSAARELAGTSKIPVLLCGPGGAP